MLIGASPILAASDVEATIRFYTDVLGFPASWTYGEPPTFGAATWGKVSLMFSERPEIAARSEAQEQWLEVDDVDALYAQHLERGAMIVSPIEDKPWDRREYTVLDPNGYHLRFAGFPTPACTKSRTLPPGVKITHRVPTHDEYRQVVGTVFNKSDLPCEIVDRTWAAVVATGPDDVAIGTARIMYDALGWFSIWDVAVLPEWQGQRIGTALMEEALSIVRQESPGAMVYLFTFKHQFYERLGFETESVQMLRA